MVMRWVVAVHIFIPSTGRQRKADLWISDQPDIQSKLQGSQGYREKPCPEKPKNKQQNKKPTMLMKLAFPSQTGCSWKILTFYNYHVCLSLLFILACTSECECVFWENISQEKKIKSNCVLWILNLFFIYFFSKMQKQVLLWAQYKPSGTLSVQQWQVPSLCLLELIQTSSNN